MSFVFRVASRLCNAFATPRSSVKLDGVTLCDAHAGSRWGRRLLRLLSVSVCALLLGGHLALWWWGLIDTSAYIGLSFSVAGANLVPVVASVAFVCFAVFAALFIRGFQQELTEARDASIELARRTLAYEPILRSPVVAPMVGRGDASSPPIIDASEGREVRKGAEPAPQDQQQSPSQAVVTEPAVLRTTAYKFVCRERFSGNVQANALGDSLESVSKKGTQPGGHVSGAAPVRSGVLAQGFTDIMDSIILHDVAVNSLIDPREMAVKKAVHALLYDQVLDVFSWQEPRPYSDMWHQYPKHQRVQVPAAGYKSLRTARVVNPSRSAILVLAVESDELLNGRPYSERGGPVTRFALPDDPIKRKQLDKAFDFISATYSCCCCRRTRNLHPLGYPDLSAIGDRDLAGNLKRVLCTERVSFVRISAGVVVESSDELNLSHRKTADVMINAVEAGSADEQHGESGGTRSKLKLCHKCYDSYNSGPGLRGGVHALFRDIGRAELIIASAFFAKVFLSNDYSDKRRLGANSARPFCDFLYGSRLKSYTFFMIGCSLIALTLCAVSCVVLCASGSALALVMSCFDLLGMIVVCGVLALAVETACCSQAYLNDVASTIALHFPSVKQYLFDKTQDEYAVNVMENFLDSLQDKGKDFPALEPIGGSALWR